MHDKEISDRRIGRKVWIAIALFVLNYALMLFIRHSGLLGWTATNNITFLLYSFLPLTLPVILVFLPTVFYRASNKYCGKVSKTFENISSLLLIIISSLYIILSVVVMID